LTSAALGEGITSIGDQTFGNCSGLINVTTGTNITFVGVSVFDSCGSLTNFVMPPNVSSIGAGAFSACFHLSEINIPYGVTNIGNSAFGVCRGMTEITVDPQNQFFSSVDGVLFDKSQGTLIQCPAGKTGTYTIPNSVTNISGAPFLSSSLTNIIISSGVTSIVSDMFNSCYGLISVTIPESVTSIMDNAFYGCTGLKSVIIPSSVTSIANQAFGDCTSLSTLYFLGNAPYGSGNIFVNSPIGTVYYLPGTTGWSSRFQLWFTALWLPQMPTNDSSFGVQANGFGFNINWASGQTVVVEASTDLINWQPVQTNTLTTGSAYFSDPQWTNYPSRYYRISSP
jgi:hypothetical protein